MNIKNRMSDLAATHIQESEVAYLIKLVEEVVKGADIWRVVEREDPIDPSSLLYKIQVVRCELEREDLLQYVLIKGAFVNGISKEEGLAKQLVWRLGSGAADNLQGGNYERKA